MSTINLNLNERERKRFAEMFRNLAKHGNQLADEIESGVDEAKIVVGFLIFSFVIDSTREFQKIVMEAAKDAKEDKAEFPSVIDG